MAGTSPRHYMRQYAVFSLLWAHSENFCRKHAAEFKILSKWGDARTEGISSQKEPLLSFKGSSQ